MSTEVLAMIGLAVFIGTFIQGATGMGFALIVAPVLGILHPALLPGGLLLLMLPLNAYVAWREWQALDRHGVKWITAGRTAGTFGGLAVLLAIPVSYLNVVIGATTILAAMATLLLPSFAPGKRTFLSTGVFTGITETATGIGGPPLALVYQHMPVATLRSSVALCFLIGEIISLVVLAGSGRIDISSLSPLVWVMPPLLIGIVASHIVYQKIETRFLRISVLVFAIVSGLFILLHR
ncbi:sulfite exporter TauE/SafE family protein [Noviherbaspirillum saxi]|uniref:Probable membrane transporter protein n=1 Tax=Noviherbaspirillum saxi TaxID=2320863 RepID=A0A3A3FIU1_9BURK|nr:sulfite exporter TauE/SafE family protein [Noviherbaspirillum saxi]RJF92454.1 sulfite exporter TauE/SafE family protein [Noviherbaspirillum saxi]